MESCVVGNQISLRLHHIPHHIFIIIRLRMARLAALEQAVIALRVEQPLLVKAGFLEAMIDVCCQHEIIFLFYKIKKLTVDRKRCIHISINIDISAPVSPVLFQSIVRIKAAGIHIMKIILFCKVRKIL